MIDTRVVILAGGKGTRLKPYTIAFPKPLVPVGDMPILEIVLRQLKSFGFKNITLAVNHLADLLISFFWRRQQIWAQYHLLLGRQTAWNRRGHFFGGEFNRPFPGNEW